MFHFFSKSFLQIFNSFIQLTGILHNMEFEFDFNINDGIVLLITQLIILKFENLF